MMAKKAREEASLQFRAEVEAEVDFLKTFPILDQSARKTAENDRENLQSKWRAEMRAYKGPLLFSNEARKAEKDRQKKLRKQFNRASARWSKIKRVANYTYQKWSNPILENMSKEADWKLFDLDLQQIELKDSIAEAMGKLKKCCENCETNTRNGSTGSGSGKSSFT